MIVVKEMIGVWGSSDCLDETCNGSAHGCGAVWTHKCDGICGADI